MSEKECQLYFVFSVVHLERFLCETIKSVKCAHIRRDSSNYGSALWIQQLFYFCNFGIEKSIRSLFCRNAPLAWCPSYFLNLRYVGICQLNFVKRVIYGLIWVFYVNLLSITLYLNVCTFLSLSTPFVSILCA